MKNLTKQQKIMLIRIISAVALLIASVGVLSEFKHFLSFSFAIYVAIYLLIGYDVIYSAIRGIFHGRLLDEKFLMLIATLGAILLGEFVEAVAVMLFYQVGEFFQGYAVGKSRRSISELMDICPEYANIEDAGTIKRVLPDLVSVGDIIIVKPGEKIPMDGVVTEGTSFLDTSSITGESVHREVNLGTKVISGCINAGSLLKIRVSKSFEDSTVSKILELIEESSFNKSKSENFISRFARVYTPAVVACAAIVFALGSLVTSQVTLWLQRALIFLVVSCPCALVVSVPLSFFAAIGCGSKNGVLIKGSNWIEALSKAETVVFDKTGTLTKGNFVITEVFPKGERTKEELIKKAYACEYYSIHPIAEAIKLSAGEICTEKISEFENLPGLGVKAKYDGKTLRCGNEKYIRQYVSDMPHTQNTPYTAVHICEDNEYLGHIIISDEIKPNAKESIHRLKKMGIKSAIFTGDNSSVALYTGKLLGCDTVESELLPHEKTERLSRLIEKKGKKRTVAFAGDGINDAPVLSMADVGIAMGSLGSDAAIEAADIVIMNDDISKITFAIRLCKKTMSIVWQNVVFSIGIKILVMVLAGLGMANMWLAVFADVGVAFLAILNAFRAFNVKM